MWWCELAQLLQQIVYHHSLCVGLMRTAPGMTSFLPVSKLSFSLKIRSILWLFWLLLIISTFHFTSFELWRRRFYVFRVNTSQNSTLLLLEVVIWTMQVARCGTWLIFAFTTHSWALDGETPFIWNKKYFDCLRVTERGMKLYVSSPRIGPWRNIFLIFTFNIYRTSEIHSSRLSLSCRETEYIFLMKFIVAKCERFPIGEMRTNRDTTSKKNLYIL